MTEEKLTETQIMVYLPHALKKKLRDIAHREEISMAQAAREAIELFCED